MASIQILTPEIIAERTAKPQGPKGRRRSAERDALIDGYKRVLAPLEPGYGGDVFLEDGDDKWHVRQNLHAAATEVGLILEFRQIRDKERIHFRVITPEQKAAKPKRGRKKAA